MNPDDLAWTRQIANDATVSYADAQGLSCRLLAKIALELHRANQNLVDIRDKLQYVNRRGDS